MYVCAVGLITNELRLLVAGLAVGHGLFVIPLWRSILRGGILAGVGIGVLVGSCLAAYLAASRRWVFHGADWEQIAANGVRGAWAELHADDAKGRRLRDQRAERAAAARTLARQKRQAALAKAAGVARLRRPAPTPDPSPPPVTLTSARAASSSRDRLLRIVAGFNIVVLSGVLAVGVGQIAAEFEPTWWLVALAGLAAFLVLVWLITEIGPLSLRPGWHAILGLLVIVGALLSSPPVGLLVLAGVIVSTWGRLVAARASEPARWLARSPLPWVVAAFYTAVLIAYEAMPPVDFPGVVITTTTTQYIGGSLSQSRQGVHLVACTALADATSADVLLRYVAATRTQITKTDAAALDPGSRPSLLALALNLVGIDGPGALLVPSLRARQPTCANAPPPALSAGRERPALGPGVIVGPATAPATALHGEPPIEQTTDARIARLARLYQPTLEVTVADRFWPVSVGAVLADISPRRLGTCLFPYQTATHCSSVTSLPEEGNSTAYLRFPASDDFNRPVVSEDPTSQLLAFERGEGTHPGSTHHWLADPALLDPWRTAEIYFYFEGPVHYAGIAGKLPRWPVVKGLTSTPGNASPSSDGLIGLQYWFFYPYNYYPLVVRGSLMNLAPLAAHVQNVDLHQGDWEHVTVLLNSKTLRPVSLYTARHADEGAFTTWSHVPLEPDPSGQPTHALVQAAFGGHPSYVNPRAEVSRGHLTFVNACGRYPRQAHGGGVLIDWLSCGSGRFAFRAATTPLVDLASRGTPWACWPGHFGEARYGFEIATPTADWFTQLNTQFLDVAGPRSPLWQAENGSVDHYGVCDQGAGASEQAVLRGPLAATLTQKQGH